MEIKKNIEEKNKSWLRVIGTLVILLTCCAVVIWYINYSFRWSIEAEYDEYAEEFNTVADFLLEQYSGMEKLSLYVSQDSQLYVLSSNVKVDCSEDVQKALQIINEKAFTYTDSSLDCIRINGNEVIFQIEAGYYAIVYSPNGEPEKIDWLFEEGYYLKKADESWYHVRSKNGCS